MLTRGSKVANKLSRGKIPAKAFCFTAGTPVLVQGGTLPIERVAVGDLVLSRDAVTGEQALKRVTETFVNTTTELVHLKMGDETISTTPKHPFWVEGSGWVDAGEVSAGDRVVLAGGERATIVSVTREKLESPLDVYNFEVEDFHTYFVASAGVWVHNACAKKPVNSGVYEFVANGKRYVGQSGNISRRLRQHAKKYGDEALNATRHAVKGDARGRAGKTAREIAEQRLLDKRVRKYGRNAMHNVVNPIGRKRMHLMGRGYTRP